MFEPEGGVDPAKLVLSRYDVHRDTFSGDKSSELWDAVELARARGELGQGRRVAVIDTGFDLRIPALAAQHTVWPTRSETRTAHGTVVALLIREVAPEVGLDLYPVGVGDQIDEDLLVRAISEAVTSDVDIINLSIGEKRPIRGVLDYARVVGGTERWPDMGAEDEPFWMGEAIRRNNSWRTWLTPRTPTRVEAAVLKAVEGGKVVIAACGNKADFMFTPALLPGVFAVSFLRAVRTQFAADTERVLAEKPFGYSQSQFSDFGLEQPELTLGSSFATPLVTGFAATMPDLGTLGPHRDAVRLAANGDELRWLIHPSSLGWERRWGVVDESFQDAVNASPHHHWQLADDDRVPCPECSLFASQAFIDGGLFWLRCARLEPAETALSASTRFAPLNPHAAANLGMLYAVRASLARDAHDLTGAAQLLLLAAKQMTIAAHLRPDCDECRLRAAEFAAAEADPGTWAFRPAFEPFPAFALKPASAAANKDL